MRVISGVPIINLAKHRGDDAQKAQGLVDSPVNLSSILRSNGAVTQESIFQAVNVLLKVAEGYEYAYVNCPIYLVMPLTDALLEVGITPVYSIQQLRYAGQPREHIQFVAHDYF